MEVTIHDIEGRIIGTQTGIIDDAPYLLAHEGHGVIEGIWDQATHYVVGPAAVERPTGVLPKTKELAIDEQWVMTTMPAGSVIKITGEEPITLVQSGLTLMFSIAGTYEIEATLPFPWVERHRCILTVGS